MAELRWNPFLQDWHMIASNRQNRPQMPKDYCPFCPSFGNVPDYEVLEYDNDFPALTQNPPTPDDVATDFFKTAPNYGKCEVILYSPGHTTTLPELSDSHMRKLVDLWCERFAKMAEDEKIKYVFPFENRGEAVGVTMPHPHGQMYGYSFIPKRIQLESGSARKYYEENGSCLFCDTLQNERKEQKRVIFQNGHFTVYLPFYSDYPYGVYIMANRHVAYLTDLTDAEKDSLGITIRDTVGMLDALFGYRFPYMMCMYSAPVNSGDYSKDFHYHIKFFPPMRSAEKQKFNASSETGAWANCNPTCPEDTSAQLREAYKRYLANRPAQNL
ncbi:MULTISPECIES: galactose-1-phosphate uridylyltransferase [Caproicibacterium]|uniref:Galactose-1-phosphate uridylyltransferase n=1 Tax=Caproicibacterium argilliputei TaxID=3030016 RepID=A0AA97D982_9FIRM|nr:galactose-1-phosphate uridylyltransferase [Caproicibacterium argilliputei]WOC31358.1 galactose-1-phosphate uridylyltransferase [Caproicibacterium argilliputei]